MEQDYIQIRELLTAIAGLSTIDEDTGQLEAMLNGEDTYPITFPAALILINDTDWKSIIGETVQKGSGTLTIRLACDCYDDTHSGAGQDSYAQQRHSLRLAIHRAIHCQKSITSGRPFIRIKSRTYSIPGRIKVYEQEYTYSAEE
jgi:hypothetical protein